MTPTALLAPKASAAVNSTPRAGGACVGSDAGALRAASTARVADCAGRLCSREKFVESPGGCIGGLAIYGPESNYTTWPLAR